MNSNNLENDERPPARPMDGLVVGGAIGLMTSCLCWAILIYFLTNGDFLDQFGVWAGSSLNYLLWLLGLPPISPAVAWPDQSPLFISAVGWRIRLSLGIGVVVGLVAGVLSGRAPPSAIHISGRQLTNSAKLFRRALAQREKLDGIALHPLVPISYEREKRHCLVVGGVGSGKTQVVLPIVAAAIERGDNCLIYDFKGDLTETFLDDDSVLLAPWDARSIAWDIASDVPDLAAARELAASLIPLPKAGSDEMWAQGARQILTGLIVSLQHRGAWSLADLSTTVSKPPEEIAAVLNRYHPEAASLLAEPNEKTALSYLSNMAANLAGMHDLARAWPQNGGFSIRQWLEGRGPRSVIVQHAESHGDLSRTLLRFLLGLIFQRVGDPGFTKAVRPTWLFLDEFLQAGRLESLVPIAETARSKDIRLVLATQDMSRVRDVYGKEQAEALAGLVGTLIMGRSRGETAQWGSKVAGNQTVRRYSRSITHAGDRQTSVQGAYHRTVEPVFRPEWFDQMLGTFGRGRSLNNLLLVLAGGDLLGLLDWPITRLPQLAEAHVPKENWTGETDKVVGLSGGDTELPTPDNDPSEASPNDFSEEDLTPRERLRRRAGID